MENYDRTLEDVNRRFEKCQKCATFNKSEGKCSMLLREAITCRAYDNALFKSKKQRTDI